MNFNVIGTVKEITWKGENSCKFIFEDDGSKVLATITKRYISLSGSLIEGQRYRISGYLTLYHRRNKDKVITENTFYVTEMSQISNEFN